MKLYQFKIGTNPIYISQQPDYKTIVHGNLDAPQIYSPVRLGLINYANVSSLAFGNSNHSDFALATNPKYNQEEFDKQIKKFCKERDIVLDPFQIEGAQAGFLNYNLIGAAPTGTGKSKIFEFKAFLALMNGKKIHICEPWKALANDQYKHFKEVFGEQNVGIVTGEKRINVQAPILIMVPEIERNIVANLDSEHRFDDVEAIVLDEYHHINDPSRGHVEEEIVMFAPQRQGLSLQMLSATMGNVAEHQGWIQYARCANPITKAITVPDYERNVPLEYYFFDAAGSETSYPHLLKLLKKSELNENVYKALTSQEKPDLERVADVEAFANYLVKNKDTISTELWRILNSQDGHSYKALGAFARKRDDLMQVMSSLKKANRGLDSQDLFKNERFVNVFKYLFEQKSHILGDINNIHYKNMSLTPLCSQKINLWSLTNQTQNDGLSFIQKRELDDFLKTLEEYKAFDTEISTRKNENEAIETIHNIADEFFLSPESLDKEGFFKMLSAKQAQLNRIQTNTNAIFAVPQKINIDKIKSLDDLLTMDNRASLPPKVVAAINSIQEYSPNNGTKLKELFYLALKKRTDPDTNIKEYIAEKQRGLESAKTTAAAHRHTIENLVEIESEYVKTEDIYKKFGLSNGERSKEKLITKVNTGIKNLDETSNSIRALIANKDLLIIDSNANQIRVGRCNQQKTLRHHCDIVSDYFRRNPNKNNQQLLFNVLKGKTDASDLLQKIQASKQELKQIRADIEHNSKSFENIQETERELIKAKEIFINLKLSSTTTSYEQLNTYINNQIASLSQIKEKIREVFSEKTPEISHFGNFEELLAESRRQPLSLELKDTCELLKKYPQSVQDAFLEALKKQDTEYFIKEIEKEDNKLKEVNTLLNRQDLGTTQISARLESILAENNERIELLSSARAMFSEYHSSHTRYQNKTVANKQELDQINRQIAEYGRLQHYIQQRQSSFSLNSLKELLNTKNERAVFDDIFGSDDLDANAISSIDNKIEHLSKKAQELDHKIQNGHIQGTEIENYKTESKRLKKQIDTLNKFTVHIKQDNSLLSLKRLREYVAEKKDEKAIALFDRLFKSTNYNIPSLQAISGKIQNLESRKKALETTIQKRLNPESLKYNNIILLLGAFSNNGATSASISDVSNNLSSYNNIDIETFAKTLSARVPVISKERAKRLGLILASKEERVLSPQKPSNIKTRIHPHQVIEHVMQIEKATGEEYLPGLYFISNKAECNRSAEHFIKNNISLIDPQQQQEVEKEIEKFLEENPYIARLREKHLELDRLNRLRGGKGIDSNILLYLDSLKQGIGVHHRGLLPPFKSLMERLFKEKKIKLIFSTDTAATGVDFPAKTVFIDSLMEPFNDNAIISPTSLKQKGGRAGRRGRDLFGRVIIVNNMPNTKNIAFELINASSDSMDSHLRINYGSVLTMLNNTTYNDSISILDRSFSVFQSKNKKATKISYANSNHPVVNQLEYTQNLLKRVEMLLRRSRVTRNKNNLSLKDKRQRLYEEMAANPLCSIDRDSAKMRAFASHQRTILNNIIIALKGYPYIQAKFTKDGAALSSEEMQSYHQLLSDLDNGILTINDTIKRIKPQAVRTELRKYHPEEYLAYRASMEEMSERLNENPFTSPNRHINRLKYQKNTLEKIKTMLTDKNMADIEIKPIVAKQTNGTVYDYFNKMFTILSDLHKEDNPLNDNKEPYFTQEQGIFRLSEKGLAAARIQGANQILASDLIYGEKALFKELTPQEILTIVSSISQGFDKERNGKMESSLPDKSELPEHLNLHFNTILSRINQIEKAQNAIGLKEGREIEFNTNLAKAFYSLAQPENSFDYVYRMCIDKTSVPGYMEGDFAEHILSSIDLLQQMREALTQKDIELKVKLGVAIKLLKKSPILEIFKEDFNLESNKFVFIPSLNNAANRVNYKGISPVEIDRVLKAANIPENEAMYNEFYQIINTSPASLQDYANVLKNIFTGEFPYEINKEAQQIMDIVDDFAANGYDIEKTAKDFKMPKTKLLFLINNFGLDDPNITIRDFYNSKLFDGGYVFEHLSVEEFKDTLLNRAAEILKSKNIPADSAYIKENLSIVKRVPLYVPGKGIEIGEADAMIYDKKLKKILLVAECKAGNLEQKLTYGLNTRMANIRELITSGVDSRTLINVDGKQIPLDKDAFSFTPEVHLITTKKKARISASLEGLVHCSRFDKVDIKLMSESLLFHLKSMLKHR